MSATERDTRAPGTLHPGTSTTVRARLLSRLDDLAGRRLAVVVAPAGCGKSTLLAQYAGYVDAIVVSHVVRAADLRRGAFGTALADALERRIAALPVPQRPAAAPPRPSAAIDHRDDGGADRDGDADGTDQLVDAVADRLEALAASTARPVLLVLDDLHIAEGSDALVWFEQLLWRLPSGVRALIGSRRLPTLDLNRLRLDDELVEVGADDLRFRSWEVDALFRQSYGTRLTPTELAGLARATDGWVAGLKLFHLATHGRTDQERRIALDRLARSRAQTVRDYLTRNVLADLPEASRRFLVRTSVLGHLTPDICDQLLGEHRSASMLEELLRQQLFTETTGPDQYRYHEVLRGYLEALLADELEPAELRAWYRRAADVLEANGATGDAVRAYVCADDPLGAARVLGDRGDVLTGGDDWVQRIPAGLFAEDAWMQLIQARRLVRDGRPLAGLQAYRALNERSPAGEPGRLAAIELRQLSRWLDPTESPADTGDWLSILRSAIRRDPGAARMASARLPGPEATVGAALAALLDGDFDAALVGMGNVAGEAISERLSDVATVSSALAEWLGGGSRPTKLVVRVCDNADRRGDAWFARILRAILLAFPSPHDPPVDVLTTTIEKASRDNADEWSAAAVPLFCGLGRALDHEHPLSADAAIELLAEAAERLTAMGAGVLAGWAGAARIALLADVGALRAGTPHARLDDDGGVAFLRTLATRAAQAADGERAPANDDRTSLRRWMDEIAEGDARRQPARAPGLLRDLVASPSAVGPPAEVPSVRVRCFGTFELSIAGVPVDLSVLKPRPRSVLRFLAVHAPHGVHRDELLDSLWADVPTPAATKSLHVALSAIRQALGPGSVALRRSGEMYALGPVEAHDLRRFDNDIEAAERAQRRGDHAAAAGLWLAAAERCVGPMLREESAWEWVSVERERYGRRLVRAHEAASAALLASGDASGAAVVAERGLGWDRFSDALWRTLEQALAASGHVVEAARVGARYHAMLVELGLREPETPADRRIGATHPAEGSPLSRHRPLRDGDGPVVVGISGA